MSACIVCDVRKSDVLVGSVGAVAVVCEGVADFLKEGLGFFNVGGSSVIVGLVLELAAVAVAHACRDVGISCYLTGLGNRVDDVLTVDQVGNSVTELAGIRPGHILEEVGVYVECKVIGTKLVFLVEFSGILDIGDFVRRNFINHIQGSGLVCSVSSCGILGKHECQSVALDIGCIEVSGVLREGHGFIVGPCGHGVSAVCDEAGLLAPLAGCSSIGISSLYRRLGNRIEYRECHQGIEVRAGVRQSYLKGIVIRSLYLQCAVVILCNDIKEVSIVCCGLLIDDTIPAVDEVLCGNGCAVGPGGLLQLYSVNGSVIGNLRHVLSDFRNDLGVLVVLVETGEHIRYEAGAVNGRVEGGVYVLGLGSKVDIDICIAFLLGALEILDAVYGIIHAGNIGLHHVDIVVVVDGDDSPGAHEHVLCLVHEIYTIGKVGVGTDLINQSIVLGPVKRLLFRA